MNINHLSISWSVSRGRDTYGYNICRLDCRQSGKRYRCSGGGYDMIGTVFGNWLEDTYQSELVALVATLPQIPYGSTGRKQISEDIDPSFYGLTIRPDGSVSLDGACGQSSMQRIARALGLEVQWEGNKKGHTIGYFVASAMAEAA
jgi:hypothetical protein